MRDELTHKKMKLPTVLIFFLLVIQASQSLSMAEDTNSEPEPYLEDSNSRHISNTLRLERNLKTQVRPIAIAQTKN
ncbi:unnamed protein product [Allacma fusca]|uniref:Agouti signaling protein n=1 Tax=Allacma fusca TaxID=39272 RepID=A0A8J2KQU4_9HEXA|nr:unnamed protein product [Allacma fusca]